VRVLKLCCYRVHFYQYSDFVMDWTIWGSIPDWAKRYFLSPLRSDSLLGPSSYLFNEYGCSFLSVKRPGRELDHSFPSSAEVRNDWGGEPRNRPRRTHRVSGGIAQLFLNLGTRRGCVVSITPQPPLPPRKTRYPLYRRLGGPRNRSG
jgi:hypothetical protein